MVYRLELLRADARDLHRNNAVLSRIPWRLAYGFWSRRLDESEGFLGIVGNIQNAIYLCYLTGFQRWMIRRVRSGPG
jgi:hypothetical protein